MNVKDPKYQICAAVRPEADSSDMAVVIGLPQPLVDYMSTNGNNSAINLRPYGIPMTIAIFIAENSSEASDRMDVMFGGQVTDLGYTDQSSQRKSDGR